MTVMFGMKLQKFPLDTQAIEIIVESCECSLFFIRIISDPYF